jgi:hypothetical protein
MPKAVGVTGTALKGRQTRLQEAAFESGLVAEFLVGYDGKLLALNREAQALFRLTSANIG